MLAYLYVLCLHAVYVSYNFTLVFAPVIFFYFFTALCTANAKILCGIAAV